MSELDDHFKNLLNENVGFGFGFPGQSQGQMPVTQAEFPETQPQEEPQEPEIQVDPFRPVVTTGETTEAGTGREDYAMEMGQYDPAIEEVGNLLITVGHILTQAGLISDKYSVPEILDFINHNFEAPEHPTEENPPQELEMPSMGIDEVPVAPPDDGETPEPDEMSQGYAYIAEKKQYDEAQLLAETDQKES